MGSGPLLGLPMGFESNVMIYNKKILDENGLQVLKNYFRAFGDCKSPSETQWGKLLRCCSPRRIRMGNNHHRLSESV